MQRRTFWSSVVASAFVWTCAPAQGQANPQVERAIEQFDEAQRAMARKDWTSACRAFAESQRLDPQLGTQLHLAHCYEKLGKVASAWLNFEQARAVAARRNAMGANEPREEVARRWAAGLESRVPTVTFVIAAPQTPGLSLECDGDWVDPVRWGKPLAVDVGAHRVRVTAPNRQEWNRLFEVKREAERLTISIPELRERQVRAAQLAPAAAAEASAPVEPSAPPLETPGSNPMKIAGYVAGAAGIAGLTVALGFAIDVRSTLNERDALCPNERCPNKRDAQRIEALNDAAQRGATRTNVALVAGGVALAAGIGLVLFSNTSESGSQVSLVYTGMAASVRMRIPGF